MTVDPFQAIRLADVNIYNIINKLTDINIIDEDGGNLLHEAVAAGNMQAGLALIQHGINVNLQDNRGLTPLHYAGIHQRSELARIILTNGGDLTICDAYGNTPLWSAVFNARGKYDTITIFSEHGAWRVAEQKNKHGRSPLDFARQINDKNLEAIIRRVP